MRTIKELQASIQSLSQNVANMTKSQLTQLGIESLFHADNVADDAVPVAKEPSSLRLAPLSQEEEASVVAYYLHRMFVLQTCINSAERRDLPYYSPPTIPFPDVKYLRDDSDAPIVEPSIAQEEGTASDNSTTSLAQQDTPAETAASTNTDSKPTLRVAHVHSRMERQVSKIQTSVLPDSTLLIAIHLFSRLYLHHSVTTFNPKLAMVVCLYMAGKIDENLLSMNELARYEYVKPEDALVMEGEIIEKCGFQLYIALPNRAKRGFVEESLKAWLPFTSKPQKSDEVMTIDAGDATPSVTSDSTSVTPQSVASQAMQAVCLNLKSYPVDHPLHLGKTTPEQLSLALSRLSRRADAFLTTCSGDTLFQYTHSQLAAAALMLACCDYINCGTETAVSDVTAEGVSSSVADMVIGKSGSMCVDGLAIHRHIANLWNNRSDAEKLRQYFQNALSSEDIYDSRTIETKFNTWECATQCQESFFLSTLPLANPYILESQKLNLPRDDSNSVKITPNPHNHQFRRLKEALSLAHTSILQPSTSTSESSDFGAQPSLNEPIPMTPFSCPLAIPITANLRYLSALPTSPENMSASTSVAAQLPFPTPDSATYPVAVLLYGYLWGVLGFETVPTTVSENATFIRVIQCSARIFAQHVSHLTFQYNLPTSTLIEKPLRSTCILLPKADFVDIPANCADKSRPLVQYAGVRARHRPLLGICTARQRVMKDTAMQAWEKGLSDQLAEESKKRAAKEAALLGKDDDSQEFVLHPVKRTKLLPSPTPKTAQDTDLSTAINDSASTDGRVVSLHISAHASTSGMTMESVGLTPALKRKLRMDNGDSDAGDPADALFNQDTSSASEYVASLIADTNSRASVPPLPVAHTGPVPASMKVEFLDQPPPLVSSLDIIT